MRYSSYSLDINLFHFFKGTFSKVRISQKRQSQRQKFPETHFSPSNIIIIWTMNAIFIQSLRKHTFFMTTITKELTHLYLHTRFLVCHSHSKFCDICLFYDVSRQTNNHISWVVKERYMHWEQSFAQQWIDKTHVNQ